MSQSLLTPRNYILALVTILVGAISYYFLVAQPSYNQALVELEQRKFEAEQKREETELEKLAEKEASENIARILAQTQETKRIADLEACAAEAERIYWSYIENNGEEVPEKPGVFFAERDSLPKNDGDGDNPAASAIRSLLQEGRMDYRTVPQSRAGIPKTAHIVREGPSVLITTGTEEILGQTGSRLFTFNVKEDLEQIDAAGTASANLELVDDDSPSEPDEALVSLQKYLQRKAPWRVKVEFALGLWKSLAQHLKSGRILRDFGRLLTMIKSVALLRQMRRQVDEAGAILAELVDYETVRKLASSMYQSTASETSPALKKLVEYVDVQLKHSGGTTLTASSQEIGDALECTRHVAKKNIRNAFDKGYLSDCRENRSSRQKYVLGLGPEPLPDFYSLPTVAAIQAEMERPQSEGGTAGIGLVPNGVPVESIENKEDKCNWDPGTPISGSYKGGIGKKGKSTPPPTSGLPKNRSQGPSMAQGVKDEQLTLGQGESPTETQGSQNKSISNPKPPWWPPPLTTEEIRGLKDGNPQRGTLAQIKTEIRRRCQPTKIPKKQKTRAVHCLARWSVERAYETVWCNDPQEVMASCV